MRTAKKMGKKKKPTADQGLDVDEVVLAATPDRRRQFGESPASFKTETGRTIERFSVVDILYENDEISHEAFMAATRYAADYDVGFNVRTTANLSNDVVDSSGSVDNFNAKRLDCAKQFTAASQSLPPESRHILSHIVLGELSMTQYAVQFMAASPKSKSSSQRAKEVLKKALNRLARHYGPMVSKVMARSRSYMAENARPTLHPFQQDDGMAQSHSYTTEGARLTLHLFQNDDVA